MSWRRKDGADNPGASEQAESSAGCLMDLIASTWVDFYHAAFVSRCFVLPLTASSFLYSDCPTDRLALGDCRRALEEEHERIRMSAVRHDLDACYSMLQQRETDLQIRFRALSRQAVSYKQGKNLAAARKKMLERARVQAQLDKIQNSILMIDAQRYVFVFFALADSDLSPF